MLELLNLDTVEGYLYTITESHIFQDSRDFH